MAVKAAGSGEKKPRNKGGTIANLKPITREAAIKGGKARAVQIHRNKVFRDIIKEVQGVPAPEDLKKQMVDMGFTDDQCTLDYAMVIGQYIAASHGDSRCATWIRDTAGQAPVKQLEITDNRDDISLYDRLLQASQAALDVKQQAYIQIPVSPPEIIDVEPDQQPDD